MSRVVDVDVEGNTVNCCGKRNNKAWIHCFRPLVVDLSNLDSIIVP